MPSIRPDIDIILNTITEQDFSSEFLKYFLQAVHDSAFKEEKEQAFFLFFSFPEL